jgi:ATP synthase protein I
LKATTARQASIAKPPLLRIFAIQAIVLLVTAAAFLWVDATTAYSVLMGGLISIVPNIYFARWAFRFSGARAARQITQSFYRGEAGKFVLTVVLFAMLFATVKPLNVVAIFLVYMFMMVLNWTLTLQMNGRR